MNAPATTQAPPASGLAGEPIAPPSVSAAPPVPTAKIVSVGGFPFQAVTRQEFVQLIFDAMPIQPAMWVSTANLDILRQLSQSAEIRELMAPVTHFVADGQPLLWAAKLQGTPLPQRVCGSDLIYDFAETAAKTGRSLYLLGGNEGAANDAAARLQELYPGLKIAGTFYPPFGFEKDEAVMEQLRSSLRESRPDVVMVALGFPKQDRLIAQLRKVHENACYIGVGISFSFVSGEVSRAPKWMQRTGLEWVYRLLQEPGRLWKRYLLHDIPFVIRLLTASLFNRGKKS